MQPVIQKLIKNTNKILFRILFGIAIGSLLLHPFALMVFWFEFELVVDKELWPWIFENVDDTVFRESFLQADLAYMGLGIFITFTISYFFGATTEKIKKIKELSRELSNDVLHLIEGGESATLEFKSSLRWDYRLGKVNKSLEDVILKTIVGFLNNQGGILLIGVSDEGSIIGLEKDYQTLKNKNRDGFQLHIMDRISQHLGADLGPKVQVFFHEYEEKDVCRVTTDKSDRPVFLKEGSQRHFFLRSGCSTRLLNVEEAVEYIKIRFSQRDL